MKLYRTSDVIASIRRARKAWTHVHVHRQYINKRPFIVDTKLLNGPEVFPWAAWCKETIGQLERWRAQGGILLNQGTPRGNEGPADAMVFFECPLSERYLQHVTVEIEHEVIIPLPVTWSPHERTIDMRSPSEMDLRAVWPHCAGKRLTNQELARACGIPEQNVRAMRRRLKPLREEWEIQMRLAPEAPGLRPAWEWIGRSRTVPKNEVQKARHVTALKELNRLGHVAVTKYVVYSDVEPDWNTLAQRRAKAIADLDQIRSLVESLPDHLQAE